MRHFDTGLAVRCGAHSKTFTFQETLQQFSLRGIIIDYEDNLLVCIVGDRACFRFYGGALGKDCGDSDGEGGACAVHTAYGDVSAHQAAKCARNGEAEASAAKLTSGGVVSLAEAFEEAVCLLWRHPDAAVDYAEDVIFCFVFDL